MTKPPPPADMRLHRLAWLCFDAEFALTEFAICPDDDVTVRCLWTGEVNGRRLAFVDGSRILTFFPSRAASGAVVLPDAELVDIERSIEAVGNLLSAAHRVAHGVSSPAGGCAHLEPLSDRSATWLATATGVMPSGAVPSRHQDHWAPFDLATVVPHLGDRLGGVSLFVEAISSRSAVGTFRELVRFFEHAFTAPPRHLAQLIADAADPRLGYSTAEAGRWFALRDRASHADLRDPILSGDVHAFIPRMKQAAYDLLINKESWRSRSTSRRELWSLPVGTQDPVGAVFARVDAPASTLTMNLMDEFDRYPLALGNQPQFSVPKHWWPNEPVDLSLCAEPVGLLLLPALGDVAGVDGDSKFPSGVSEQSD